ncbi:hypothetical protein SAMD00019534_081560, partial [Acytostelium subglobosum LB1]|uniref:hypothetical protein n=1 Tax=Acytostelium subglobosum LB1 TaxID=1410327 RepID=UPI00064483B3
MSTTTASEMNVMSPTGSSIAVAELVETTEEYRSLMDRAQLEDFNDIEALQCFFQVGTDTHDGSPVFLLIGSSLPVGKEGLNKLLAYMCKLLEPIVTGSQYTLVYSHHLLSADSTPDRAWLMNTYNLLPRNYKKNLKNMYIIHPSTWLRMMFMALSPFMSEKVWNKVVYIDYLQELPNTLNKELIKDKLPGVVKVHDVQLLSQPEVVEQVATTMETLGKEMMSSFAMPTSSLYGSSDPQNW